MKSGLRSVFLLAALFAVRDAVAAEGSGALVLMFALLFVVLPLAAALVSLWPKRYVLHKRLGAAPGRLAVFGVSLAETALGIAALAAWWNRWGRGITCLVVYLTATSGLNLLLARRRNGERSFGTALALAAVPVLIALALLLVAPGDSGPVRRFQEVVSKLME